MWFRLIFLFALAYEISYFLYTFIILYLFYMFPGKQRQKSGHVDRFHAFPALLSMQK